MKKFIIIATAFFTALTSFAWGQKGHDVVAHIAECHLTPAAADSVAALLDGKSPVYWANWLDNASHTPEYAYTKTWHYKNIDAHETYEGAKLNENGDVVRAIRGQISVLSDPLATREQKTLALRILIHVVGDLHQPMHMGHLSDLGGNRTKVRYFDRDTNLHSVWDGSLVNSAHAWTYTEWRDQIDRLTPEQRRAEAAGNVDDWARQTFEITAKVYDAFPIGSNISYNQIAEWTPVIEQQLERGGLRLARILNALFTPSSTDSVRDF